MSGSEKVDNTPYGDINIEDIEKYSNPATDFSSFNSNTFASEETTEKGTEKKSAFKPITTKTYGRYSRKRRGGVLRYPLELMTDHTDYLQIDIQKYVPLNNYVSRPGDSRRYVTGNNFSDRAGRRTAPNLSTKPLINDGTILLPIPSEIKDVNTVNVGTSELNGLAGAGAQLIEGGSDALAGSDLLSREGRENLVNEIKKEFGTFKNDVTGGVGSIEAATNFLNKQFASQILGVFGANVSANDLLARSNGEIINPNMELLFNGPAIRNFRFNFKMTPRNEKEAEQIKLIIRAFKRNMAPQANGGTVNSGSFFLKTPNVFELRYRTGRNNHPFLNRFKQCFLSNMSVRYTGEGVYSTYEDGTPVSMILDLEFKETQPIYDIDYDERPGDQAVGY
tara:strand:+ start:41 stop:1219 length:1179 start_codon:yes stop_codon:yes gene_type:complete